MWPKTIHFTTTYFFIMSCSLIVEFLFKFQASFVYLAIRFLLSISSLFFLSRGELLKLGFVQFNEVFLCLSQDNDTNDSERTWNNVSIVSTRRSIRCRITSDWASYYSRNIDSKHIVWQQTNCMKGSSANLERLDEDKIWKHRLWRSSASPTRSKVFTEQGFLSRCFFSVIFRSKKRNVFEMTEKIKPFWLDVWKYKLINTVMASFNTVVRELTEIYEWPKCLVSAKMTEMSQRKKTAFEKKISKILENKFFFQFYTHLLINLRLLLQSSFLPCVVFFFQSLALRFKLVIVSSLEISKVDGRYRFTLGVAHTQTSSV